MMAPAPVMAPAMPNMPMAPEMVMPVAPMVAPKAADDMSGSVGFGVGVSAGDTLVRPDTTNLMMKYWVNDAMALLPRLSLHAGKAKGADMAWSFAPSVLADFTLIKGASTRLSFGVGLGLSFSKEKAAATSSDPATPPPALPKDTTIDLFIPAGLNVEHFFARWFSMGVGATFNVIDFTKVGDGWQFDFNVNNVKYLGSLFFYTD
jgi:hypothetical protein